MGQTSFPTAKEGLHTYLSGVVPYADTNKVRLKISTENMTALTTLYGDIATPGTYLFTYALWALPGSGRTKDVIDDLVSLENSIKSLLTSIFNDIPASVWTNADRNAFNRRTGLPKTPTHPTEPIVEECYVKAKAKGGGDVILECSSLEDASRPSKPAGADAVEIAFRIDMPVIETDGAGNDLASKVRFKSLADADDGTAKAIFTRAKFTARLGTKNSGNYLLFYARWINTHHPELAGTWTGPYSLLIS
jgi:hypothetical protein